MKILTTSILGFTLLFFSYIAYASEKHKDKHHTYPAQEKPIQTIIYNTTTIERVVKESSGAALSGATSQLQFDKNISGWQAGVGVYTYDGNNGYAFGVGKQVKDKTILNFTVGKEGNKTGAGLGLNWTFK